MNIGNNLRIGILLTLMILLNTVVASATIVNFDPIESNESIYGEWDISPQEAYRVSNAVRIDFMADGTCGLEGWPEATFDPNPIIIYDMNGQRLYYEFFVKNSSGIIGSMKVNANKTLGYAVKTFESGSNLEDYERSRKKVKDIVSEKYPNKEILSTKLVFYSISQMGISATLRDKSTGEESKIIIDIYSSEEIPENRTCSRLDIIPEETIEENLLKWEINAEHASKLESITAASDINISNPFSDKCLKKIKSKTNGIELKSKKRLDVLTSYKMSDLNTQYETLFGTLTDSVPDEKILDMNNHKQENGYYCAAASGQMIAEYYGVIHSQDHIFQMMEGTENGIYPSKSLLYYKAPSPNGLNKPNSEVKSNPDFLYTMYEIYHDRPFVSSANVDWIVISYGHARVCKGYKKDDNGNYLRIADPSRLNIFQMDKWERWDEIERTSDVFVK